VYALGLTYALELTGVATQVGSHIAEMLAQAEGVPLNQEPVEYYRLQIMILVARIRHGIPINAGSDGVGRRLLELASIQTTKTTVGLEYALQALARVLPDCNARTLLMQAEHLFSLATLSPREVEMLQQETPTTCLVATSVCV
jgi:hypothetical protein